MNAGTLLTGAMVVAAGSWLVVSASSDDGEPSRLEGAASLLGISAAVAVVVMLMQGVRPKGF